MNIGFNLQSYKCCDMRACVLALLGARDSVVVSHSPGMSAPRRMPRLGPVGPGPELV